MTQRSPRRPENRIAFEESEQFQTKVVEKPMKKPAAGPEKPKLNIADPLFWEEPSKTLAPPGRRQNTVRVRHATYAPEPELRADILHRQSKPSPEQQIQNRQAVREEQLRRMERQKKLELQLRTDMPSRGDEVPLRLAAKPAPRPEVPLRPAPQAVSRPEVPLRPAPQVVSRPEVQRPSRDFIQPPSKKVFSRAFKKGFFISWAVFLILLIAGLAILWVRLQKYEKGLPDHAIAAVCEEVGKGNISGLHTETADGRALTDEALFVDAASISSALQKKKEETPLSYVKVNAESSEYENVYLIRSGDQDLVKVYLGKPSKEEGWEETKTVLCGEEFAVRKLAAQIPSSGTLLLGETEIPRTFVTEKGSQVSILSGLVEQGILKEAPTLDTYNVEGIFPEVQVSMKAENGKTVSCSLTDNVYIAGFEADEAFAEEQRSHVISMFEPYATYFSGDAEGDVLHDIMLDPSPAYESASSADVSWMQEHDDVQISEESVENFRKYSDDCFSCDIHFIQDIYQDGDVVRTWDTNMTWIFVKDGDFYIADFITKTEA